ncbi:MAG: DUF4421 family protein [Bacteroidota bacterium]
MLLTLYSCSALDKLKRTITYDVLYTDVVIKNKEIRYVEMVEVGQPEFFENVRRLTERSENEGYHLFYEGIKYEDAGRTDLLKLKKMTGFIPDSSGYLLRYKIMLDHGYALWVTNPLVKRNPPVLNVDLSVSELVEAYEKAYGVIVITGKDTSVPLSQHVGPVLPKEQVNAIITNYRGRKLAERVYRSPHAKIIMLYDVTLKETIIKELKVLEGTDSIAYKVNSTKNSAGYLQPLSADSFRKINTTHIIHDGYVDRMNDYVNVKLSVKDEAELFVMNSKDRLYLIYPNSGVTVKANINYKAISAGFSYVPMFLRVNKDVEQKGRSSGFAFTFGLIHDHWFHDFLFRYNQGFYIKNTSDLVPQWQAGDAYLQRPKMTYACLEGRSGYKFNSKFSLRALNTQTERQLKSTGSFMLTGVYRYYATDTRELPLAGDSLQRSHNIELAINAGYFHTWVFKKGMYFSAGFNPGFGLVRADVSLRNAQGEYSQVYTRPVVGIEMLATLGYNGERFLAGVYANINASVVAFGNAPVLNTDSRKLYLLFIGYRLSPARGISTIRM